VRHFGRRFVPQSTIDRRVQAKDDRINRATQLRAAKAAALKVAAELLKPAPVDPDAHDGPACGPSCFHPYLTEGEAERLLSLERDPDDRDDRDDDAGARCTAACGFCGRCS
jgi:hypothetical protein